MGEAYGRQRQSGLRNTTHTPPDSAARDSVPTKDETIKKKSYLTTNVMLGDVAIAVLIVAVLFVGWVLLTKAAEPRCARDLTEQFGAIKAANKVRSATATVCHNQPVITAMNRVRGELLKYEASGDEMPLTLRRFKAAARKARTGSPLKILLGANGRYFRDGKPLTPERVRAELMKLLKNPDKFGKSVVSCKMSRRNRGTAIGIKYAAVILDLCSRNMKKSVDAAAPAADAILTAIAAVLPGAMRQPWFRTRYERKLRTAATKARVENALQLLLDNGVRSLPYVRNNKVPPAQWKLVVSWVHRALLDPQSLVKVLWKLFPSLADNDPTRSSRPCCRVSALRTAL